jgi:hypothetical protein
MAYFPHAFRKIFIGTSSFITTSGVTTATLADSTPGTFGFFDAKTMLSVTGNDVTGCCPLVLASSSLYTNDKIGPFHGGYKESNKSKMINPKFISQFYRVDSNNPSQAVVHLGTTAYTSSGIASIVVTTPGSGYTNGTYYNVPLTGGSGTGAYATVVVSGGAISTVTITSPGINYASSDTLAVSTVTANGGIAYTAGSVTVLDITAIGNNGTCTAKDFYCGSVYNLRVDIKGSPALQFLNHNIYRTFMYNGGCCANPSIPSIIDSTLVMIDWAEQMTTFPIIKDFIKPVVVSETGVHYYAPGTENVLTWDNYVSPGHTSSKHAGLIIYGAYVDTRFGNASFQVSDFFQKEPIQLYASLIDNDGDPCTFDSLCVNDECKGHQGNGFGETVLRDLILSESYRQNFFHTDIRIREITQGSNLFDVINRTSLYTRYFILHSVPRYNNPTGIHDNDQYLLEIVTSGTNANFESFMAAWLDGCTNCVSLETKTDTICTPSVTLY